ncbi:MAG: uroporphyrinogen-III synthase [Rhodocyclaceae bacterium]|nr:uroporphyrinogen-III synthase [Rhodocyclaceae bacterium]
MAERHFEPAGAAPALAGHSVVVTRPRAQSEPLAARIRAAGGVAIVYPLLAIEDADDPAELENACRRLGDYQYAMFVSPNAVERALTYILARRDWPPQLRVAAVGAATASALARHGIAGVIAPQQRFDSEALLELPELAEHQVRGRRVVVFRGQGGRELFADTLRARGALVDHVQCYRRVAPAGGIEALLASGADAMAVSSSEGLRNLWQLLDARGRDWLAALPLFVPHARIAEQAAALGLQNVVRCGAGDDGLMEALMQHFAQDMH